MSSQVCALLVLQLALLSWPATGSPVDRGYTLPVLQKRDGDSQASCNTDSVPALSTTPLYDFTETKDELQALWMKRDVLLLVATDTTTSTTLYIGTSSSATHLYSLHHDTTSITGPVDTASLKITVGLSAVILVSADKKSLYVSRDNAVSWTRHTLPAAVGHFIPKRDLTLSHTHSSTLLLHSPAGHLYLSRDYGTSWVHIDSNVLQATLVPGGPQQATEYLFYSKVSNNKVFNPLHRVDLSTLQSNLIDSHSYLYVADDRYLFVSRQNYTGNDQSSKLTRRFYVSTNFGVSQPAFSEVQLPAATWEDYVAVMGTHETGAFIHISNQHDKEKGDLYVSGVSGSQFTVSLKNHLLKRLVLSIPMAGNRLITFDDFYEVLSMRGVYMSTQVDDNAVGKHYSMITFDNGGRWQRISLPSSHSHCINCSLHVHISYSRLAAAESGVGGAFRTGPLSSSNAPGIIIAHGSVGVAREYNASNAQIVVSQDGGMSWKLPNIPKGQYVYGIADYGNIISVVPDTKHSRFLWFSHDRGNCFTKAEFGFNNLFHISRGLLMDPNTTSLYGFVLGMTGTSSDSKWTAITLNFGSLLSYPCHDEDYNTIQQPQCVLGYKHSYQVTKPQSMCYNEHKLLVTTIKCNCTDRDYECGYGYLPQWSNDGSNISCKKDPQFSLAKVCPPGATSYQQSNTGLQLIAGEQCIPTDESTKKLAMFTHPCTGHESDSGIVIDVASATGRIIGGLILLLVVVLSCALVLYCWLRCRAKPVLLNTRDRVIYKKIPLTADSSEHSSTDEDILN